tara:strand:- start:819 stop:1319 length:501 start_codon:yes stop_codon:yes gene_type:complete
VNEMKTLDGKGNTIEVIDVDQAVNELKQIVKETPFFQYPLYQFCECERWASNSGPDANENECEFHAEEGCRYFNTDNEPVCVIGKWLDSHNLNTPESFGVNYIKEIEGQNASEVLDKVQQNVEFIVDDDARDFLTLVQQAQDTGMTWVDAFNNNLPHELKFERLGE